MEFKTSLFYVFTKIYTRNMNSIIIINRLIQITFKLLPKSFIKKHLKQITLII